jgi:hypothetical protein
MYEGTADRQRKEQRKRRNSSKTLKINLIKSKNRNKKNGCIQYTETHDTDSLVMIKFNFIVAQSSILKQALTDVCWRRR